jgi:NitT/TauT family transport system substrate-binding protein
MHWINRTLNQATAAAIAAFMLASSAQADDPVRLRLNWMYYGSHAGFAYGKDKGYYKDVGIDLDIAPATGRRRAIVWWQMATAHFLTAPVRQW